MKRMPRIRKLLAVLIIGSVLLFAGTGYVMIRPGTVEDLSGFVTVDQGSKDHEGRFFLVTVTQQSASPLLLLYAILDPAVDLQQKRQLIPPGMDIEEFNDVMRRLMEESQNMARVIALRTYGIDVPIESDGVEVVDIEPDSPAKGLLQPGDIVREVDGKPVFLAQELAGKVQMRPVGEPVNLRILRDGKEKVVAVPTARHPDLPEKAAIRVLIQTLNWQPLLPIDIRMDTGQIAGPSAGLMFVLEILNQLEPVDMTSGRLIAGTGTINLDAEVGPIGGVRQKVIAAEKAGAEFFLVPQENFAEAGKAAGDITLVSVSTLSDALQFLQTLAKDN